MRARGLLSIPAAPPTPEELLAAALRSPLLDRGLPVRLAAYTLTDAAAGKVRVLMAARVGGSTRPLSVGFALADAAGKVAASRAYEGIAGGEGEWVEFTAEAVVDPAAYNLRLAAVDAGGRRGSVEHTVKAALLDRGRARDLGSRPGAFLGRGGAVRPAVDLELEGGGLSALLELAGRDPARLARATVAIELAESAEGRALLQGSGGAGGGRARTAREWPGSRSPPASFRPGDYAARAEVSVDGKPVAVVTRPFRVVPPRAGAPTARAPLAGLLVETTAFDRAELLTRETLGHFMDRLGELVPGPVPAGVAAAIVDARQGRPEAMMDRLGDAAKDDPRVAFLRGVSYYARGNLPAALTQLQAALRLDSELFPAAVYMGACYAASGKDLDAIGAWQTALIGEVGSPRAVRAPRRRARPGEGAGAGGGDPERGPRRLSGRRGPSAPARDGLRDGGPGGGGPAAAHRVGGRPPGGPGGALRHAGPPVRGILAGDGGGGGRRRSGSASRATRRPTWTARVRTAR